MREWVEFNISLDVGLQDVRNESFQEIIVSIKRED